jgi:hypothetical protein
MNRRYIANLRPQPLRIPRTRRMIQTPRYAVYIFNISPYERDFQEKISSESQTSGWEESEKSWDATASTSHISQSMSEEDKQRYEEQLVRLRAELTESHDLRSGEREETEILRSQLIQLEKQLVDMSASFKEATCDRDASRAFSEAWQRKYDVANSRLKIVELEADRPLWEEAKKRREMREKEESEKAKQRADMQESERKLREILAQEKARQARKEAERKAHEREVQEQKEKERQKEAAKLKSWKYATQAEQERCRARDRESWGHLTLWTDKLALRRVTLIMSEFSQVKFSEGQPLTFENIPWPVLNNPLTLDVGDITWDNVEAFFALAKLTHEPEKYKKFVETIHRLFHPDKWRARRALETVMDASLRQALENAGNVVSQAITPLWREARDGS